MNVIFLPETLEYLEHLIITLYEKEYFGFLDSSERYVEDFIDDIKTTLPLRPSKPAPKRFSRYGKDMEYASFRKNRRTIWYVFFETYEDNGEITYLVRHISNNHVIAQHL
jgi:hypothetical protein